MISVYRKERIQKLPDAVFFDIDNTLYPYNLAQTKAQKAVKDKAIKMLSIKPNDFDTLFEEARRQIKAQLQHTASSHNRLLYFERMLELLGLGSQMLLSLDFEQTYWRVFFNNCVLFDSVKELLDDFRLLNIPMAVVTDLTAQVQFRKLIYLGLDHSFDYIVTSEEAGFDKPHQAPFQMALEKIQPKGECIWMIGDDPMSDVYGGHQSIDAITFQKLHTGVQEGIGLQAPDATFHEFKELRHLIKQLEVSK